MTLQEALEACAHNVAKSRILVSQNLRNAYIILLLTPYNTVQLSTPKLPERLQFVTPFPISTASVSIPSDTTACGDILNTISMNICDSISVYPRELNELKKQSSDMRENWVF